MQLPTFEEENLLWSRGVEFVIGADEVGRGSFAGPVTAGAVVFRKKSIFENGLLTKINDSKLLEAKIRESLTEEIKKEALCYAISTIGVSTINNIGIGKATQMAIRRCVGSILKQIDYNKSRTFLLIDGFHIKNIREIGLKNQKGIIKGDRKSISIAAASIIAKVHRDNLMRKLNTSYPQYNFYQNKGYGTRHHREAISRFGLSEIHRTSFNLQKFL